MKRIYIYLAVFMLATSNHAQVPDDFVSLTELDTTIRVEARYYSSNNFVGDTIRGYHANKVYLTRRAAKALLMAHRRARKLGLALKIFDAYRPQRAVDHFVVWSRDLQDTLMKAEYYPDIRKVTLFDQGYIASRSGHSRGSTVDLTLCDLETGEEVDMGSPFDLFDERSNHTYQELTAEQLYHRKLLAQLMKNAGFRPYVKEWWHYTLNNEPYPDRYFDFEIK